MQYTATTQDRHQKIPFGIWVHNDYDDEDDDCAGCPVSACPHGTTRIRFHYHPSVTLQVSA